MFGYRGVFVVRGASVEILEKAVKVSELVNGRG